MSKIQIGKVAATEAHWKWAMEPNRKIKVLKFRKLLRAIGAPNKDVKSAGKPKLFSIFVEIVNKHLEQL